ncbi:MAG: hypothetical protein WCX73_01075 [Candidatus Pacearchaeota archaeon]|jgi:hypothetical protein
MKNQTIQSFEGVYKEIKKCKDMKSHYVTFQKLMKHTDIRGLGKILTFIQNKEKIIIDLNERRVYVPVYQSA